MAQTKRQTTHRRATCKRLLHVKIHASKLLLCVARLNLRHVHEEEGSGLVNMNDAKLILTMKLVRG